MTIRSALYVGEVFHRRTRPREHTLRYRVFTLLVDLQELDALAARTWLLSRNRWNLLSIHDRDFGERAGEPLPAYVARVLSEAGEHRAPSRILMSCYPRVLGYEFNPLTLFYCLDDSGDVFGVVHEVHNTFGERHTYVLQPEFRTSASDALWIHQQGSKALFVSPFAQMNMHYEFRLNVPDERQVVVIRAFDEKGQWLTASYTASRLPLEAAQLLRCFVTLPLLTVKVIAAIHWEAARLWLKRVPWFTHKPKTTDH